MNELVSDVEMTYLADHFPELRQQYAGMWIAIVGTSVVAAAATAGTLRTLLDGLKIEVPFVRRMPAWGEQPVEFPSLWSAPE